MMFHYIGRATSALHNANAHDQPGVGGNTLLQISLQVLHMMYSHVMSSHVAGGYGYGIALHIVVG